MLCWVLGLLVIPTVRVPLMMYWLSLATVSPLAPGVSAGEGVEAFGLGGFGLGVGAVLVWVSQLPVLGVGLGVVGRLVLLGVGARHSLLRASCVVLIGLPLCPSGVSGGPAAPLAEGCWVLVLWVFLCCVRLWCGRCWRFGVLCAFVGLVLVAAVAVCVVCARRPVCGVLVVRLGACPRLSGLGLAALCGCGGCVSWRLSCPGCGVLMWFSASPGCGLLVVVSSAAPFACPPSFFSLPRRLGRCSPGALLGPTRAVVGVRWGGWSLTLALVSSPGVSPWGGRWLHSPSGCNSVVRAVHLYLLGTNGPVP